MSGKAILALVLFKNHVWTMYLDEEVATCLVCWDNEASIVMVPCGHMCLCTKCRSDTNMKVMQHKCPVCRKEVDKTISIKKAKKSMRIFVPFSETPSISSEPEMIKKNHKKKTYISTMNKVMRRMKRRVRPLRRVFWTRQF
jgi:hypothetical protein